MSKYGQMLIDDLPVLIPARTPVIKLISRSIGLQVTGADDGSIEGTKELMPSMGFMTD